jgi:hypothetical protein
VEVVRMLDQLPQQRSSPDSLVPRSYGERMFRWSWYLFLLSYPSHVVGGGIAIAVTALLGGDFTAGEGVPRYVYLGLYVWMLVPLVASIVVGVLAWLKGHRGWAILPVLASAAMIAVITMFGANEWFGL